MINLVLSFYIGDPFFHPKTIQPPPSIIILVLSLLCTMDIILHCLIVALRNKTRHTLT